MNEKPIEMLDLRGEHHVLREEILAAIGSLLEAGQFVLGEPVKRFEREVADYLGVKHAIGVSSGTDALWLALRAVGTGPGDEVITPTYSFFAVSEAIERCGATPVFVDVDPRTFLLDDEQVLAAIGPRTKAVVPVHLYGLAVPLDRIRTVLKEREIALIEDAAQAIGADWKGEKVGSIGDLAAFSFYPTKNLGCCGDGGLVTTGRDDLAEEIRVLRDHGQTGKYEHGRFGWNCRLDAFQAAVLSIKLPSLDRRNEARRRIAAVYSEKLRDLPLRLPEIPESSTTVWHQYAVRVADRDSLATHLGSRGIASAIHYPRCLHEQPAYLEKQGPFPVAEQAAREVLCLPVHPGLTREDALRVSHAIREWVESANRPVATPERAGGGVRQ